MCIHHNSGDGSTARNSNGTTGNDIAQNDSIKRRAWRCIFAAHPLIDANPENRSARHSHGIPTFLSNIRLLGILLLGILRGVRLAVRRTIIGWVRTSLLRRVLASLWSPIRRRILTLLWRSTTLRRARGVGIVLRLWNLGLRWGNRSVGLKIR